MSPTTNVLVDPQAIVRTMVTYRWRWLVPTVALTVFALAYAVLQQPKWEASQALLIRDEAAGGNHRPGRFDGLDAMKTAQETVLELARSRAVLAAALAEVGPHRKNGPTATDIERLRDAVTVAAPGGAEFGKTEVFYVRVRDRKPERAVQLAQSIYRQLDQRLRDIRNHRAASLVQELQNTVTLARADLSLVTKQLSSIEQSVGDDLTELRILSDSVSGDSYLRQTIVQVKSELRQVRTAEITTQRLFELLTEAQRDPTRILATPNDLLQSQPALRQLKEGLVVAELKAASLLGDLTERHPQARAAAETQQEIRRRIHTEIESALRSIAVERQLNQDRVLALQEQLDDLNGRIGRLAEVRADYANRLSEIRRHGDNLQRAEKDLADARASQAAAQAVSLITPLESASTGEHPVGPRRAVIVLGGLLGGLFTGIGILLLTVPQPSQLAPIAASTGQVPVIDAGEPQPSAAAAWKWLRRVFPGTPAITN